MSEAAISTGRLICKCGCTAFALEASDMHGFGVRCAKCGKFNRWTGKGREKKNNPKHRKKHRAEGEMVCDWCGISESEAAAMGLRFEIDHREAESFGGSDDFENTRPLCSACHCKKQRRRTRPGRLEDYSKN